MLHDFECFTKFYSLVSTLSCFLMKGAIQVNKDTDIEIMQVLIFKIWPVINTFCVKDVKNSLYEK